MHAFVSPEIKNQTMQEHMARIWQIQFFNTLGDNAVFLIKDKCKSYSVKLKEKLVLQHPSMFS